MANEISRTDVVKFARVPVVAISDTREHSDPVRVNQKIVGSRQQSIATIARKGPGERIAKFEVERHTQVRVKVPLNIEFGAIGNCKIDLSSGDFRE